MDRDRDIEREAAGTTRRRDDSLFVAPATSDRVIVEGNRDVAGDAMAPSDQDIVVREDAVDTMPSRALNDPREMTPDQMQRHSTDTTATPKEDVVSAGQRRRATAGGRQAEAVNMAGRPLEPLRPTGVNVAQQTTSEPRTGGAEFERGGTDVFAQIREGMRVIDAGGEDLGKVDFFKAGDPEAITTEGQEPLAPTGGIIGDFGRALTGTGAEPDVPEPFRTYLIRTGFIKVDGKGWFDTDRYLTAEMIGHITGDEVHLSVTRDNIPNNQGKDR